MAVRTHEHAGYKGPHPVNHAHRSGKAIAAHDQELREHGRNKIKAYWKTPHSAEEDLHKLKPFTKPSTMDKRTHAHFQKIVGSKIAEHQKQFGLPKNYVKKDFHQVVMPEAWRKLKETHYQEKTGSKWLKKEK